MIAIEIVKFQVVTTKDKRQRREETRNQRPINCFPQS